MKLFQIEEPDGSPLDAAGPGLAVGIAIGKGEGAVAYALGGNAEILPGADGARLLVEKDLARRCSWVCVHARKSNWPGR